jgi:rhodanese-related sulfurtransferase
MAQKDNIGVVVLDLRKPEDFRTTHIPGSCNLPLQSVDASTQSPFFDSTILEKQWRELDATFTPDRISAYDLAGKQVYLVCYHGDTARVATSVLRAKGITATSVKGGMAAVQKDVPQLQLAERGREVTQQNRSTVSEIVAKEFRADSLSPKARGQTGVVI